MKQQIRTGMFETNSSSVHALIIPMDERDDEIPKIIYVLHGDYDWDFRRYYHPNDNLSYLCQGIFSATIYNGAPERPIEKRMATTEQIIRSFVKPFEDMGIEIRFFDDYFDVSDDATWHDNGCFDHSSEFMETVYNELKDDFEKVKRFVFSGKLATANDNTDGYIEFLQHDVDPQFEEVLWKWN